MPVKLVVSSTVAFDVRFTLNTEGKEQEFGFRLEARREPYEKVKTEMLAAAAADPEKFQIASWLRQRVDLRMCSWIGEPALKDDETDAFSAPGETALEALTDFVSNLGQMVWGAYAQAVSAKGKSGN